jgi:hypothetical protein
MKKQTIAASTIGLGITVLFSTNAQALSTDEYKATISDKKAVQTKIKEDIKKFDGLDVELSIVEGTEYNNSLCAEKFGAYANPANLKAAIKQVENGRGAPLTGDEIMFSYQSSSEEQNGFDTLCVIGADYAFKTDKAYSLIPEIIQP